MEFEEYAVVDWPGWRVSRRAERSWWVYRGERYVGEIGVIGTGEWWIRPDGDALPWAAMHGDLRAAVGALASWWAETHPFGDGGR